MPMSADPTLEFLAALDDPRRYERRENVPVFVPHRVTKKMPDGTAVEVEVTADDLETIAANANAREAETGTLVVITLGHRLRDPDQPERAQPPVVGYARAWKVGTFGPARKLALLCTEYIRRDRAGEINGYPFRSAEYYPPQKEITAVCHLIRDPQLDLGMVAFAGDDRVLCYSREVNMPDPTVPPDPSVVTPADGEDRGREDYLKHCYSHPYARDYHTGMLAKYAAAGAAPGPGVPGPTDVAPPAPVPPAPEKDRPDEFARREQAAQYARLEAERRADKKRIEALEKRLAESDQRAQQVQYARELEQLAAEEGIVLDVEEELAVCGCFGRDQFDAHKKRIATHYQRGPAGGQFLPTPRLPAANGSERSTHEKALALATRKGLDYDTALAQVKAGGN